MNMEIEFRRTPNPSPAKGSLAWLVANIGHVRIDTNKAGNSRATLMGKDGAAITLLCLQNAGPEETDGNACGPVRLVSNSTGCPYEDHDGRRTYTSVVFTDAAFRVVRAMAEAAREEILAAVEADDAGLAEDEEVEVVVVRVKDRDAAALARAFAGGDPVALPLLRDRVKEAV